MERKVDWIIHGVANGFMCKSCGKAEKGFVPHACNFHTHGMAKYGHLDFQMVLEYPHKEICRILNTLGLRVQAGNRYKSGDLVYGIYEDCAVLLTEFEEDNRTVLRVIIPDRLNRFPGEDGCEYPYTVQLFATDFLCWGGIVQ